MSEAQKYIGLVLTQMISTIVALCIAGCLMSKNVYQEPPFDWYIILSITFIIIVSLSTSKPLLQYYNLNFGSNVNRTIWLIYILDIIALFYLISNSGGLSQSPFGPLLIFLPANGAILDQEFKTVIKYYVGIVLLAMYLVFSPPEIIINKDQIFHYKMAVFIIYIYTIIILVVSFWMRQRILGKSNKNS